MQFESVEAFLQMGKHGAYVWSAYGISFVLMGLNVALAVRAQRQAKEDVKRFVRREMADANKS